MKPDQQTTNMSKLPDLKYMMCHIEDLLKEAETSQDTTRQREYIKRIDILTSKVKTSLLSIEARQGDDIETLELNILWTSLVYAHFKNNMIFMAPYKKKLDIYRYELPDLRSRIHYRIIITKRCLTELTSPIQNPIQEHIHREYIKRIQELTQQANTDISDIEARKDTFFTKRKHKYTGLNTSYLEHSRKDIFLTELKNFKTSLYNIECETSAVFSDLCTWKASPPLLAKNHEILNGIHAQIVEEIVRDQARALGEASTVGEIQLHGDCRSPRQQHEDNT